MRIFKLVVAGILVLIPLLATEIHGAELSGGSITISAAFTSDEIRIIRAHYHSQSASDGRGKPKHRNKPRALPPGIAKNLARGKPLPPGIAKQFLPDSLLNSLPPVIDGHERIIVGGKILLVEIATQVVRDVLTDVLFS